MSETFNAEGLTEFGGSAPGTTETELRRGGSVSTASSGELGAANNDADGGSSKVMIPSTYTDSPVIRVDGGREANQSYFDKRQATEAFGTQILEGIYAAVPEIGQTLSMLGYTPSSIVGKLVQKWNRDKGSDTANAANIKEEIEDHVIDLVQVGDSQSRIFRPGLEVVGSSARGSVYYDDLRETLAIINRASDALPGGVRDLLWIRAAIAIENDMFNDALEYGHGIVADSEYARIPDMAELLQLRGR